MKKSMTKRVLALFEKRRTVSRLELRLAFPCEHASALAAVRRLVRKDRLRGYGSTWRGRATPTAPRPAPRPASASPAWG